MPSYSSVWAGGVSTDPVRWKRSDAHSSRQAHRRPSQRKFQVLAAPRRNSEGNNGPIEADLTFEYSSALLVFEGQAAGAT